MSVSQVWKGYCYQVHKQQQTAEYRGDVQATDSRMRTEASSKIQTTFWITKAGEVVEYASVTACLF
ncbi:hypothetical protein GJ744_008351 [Endocarpon pusillum]|uniref:Uncharacterized protein n=1 Tax=Endocarpon pusillum TaxID=364733 RepID=A0A8H7E3F6_9EURO|nr:hypothetical protein GJ744_008351 [Endocarpon pusillum]